MVPGEGRDEVVLKRRVVLIPQRGYGRTEVDLLAAVASNSVVYGSGDRVAADVATVTA